MGRGKHSENLMKTVVHVSRKMEIHRHTFAHTFKCLQELSSCSSLETQGRVRPPQVKIPAVR